MPTQPQPFVPWLSVATQALQGRQRRQDVDYERSQEERAYNDQQEQRRQQMATQADATQYARAQDRRRNERQDNLDLAAAYDRGFIPQEQAQSQGQVAAVGQQMQPFDTTGVGPGLQAAGNAVQQAPSVYSIAGKALVKGRQSEADRVREDQQTQARDLREAQSKTQLQIAAEALQGKKELAAEALQGRKEVAGIAAGARSDSRMSADQARQDRLQNTFVQREAGRFQNNPTVKRAQTRADILNQVLSAMEVDNPIGDYVLSTEVAKLADPLHIVTDAAHSHIATLPGASEKVQQLVKNLATGTRLTPSMRTWIKDLALNEAANGARQVDPLMRNGGETLRRRGYEADSASVYPDPFEAVKTLPSVQKAMMAPSPTPSPQQAPSQRGVTPPRGPNSAKTNDYLNALLSPVKR